MSASAEAWRYAASNGGQSYTIQGKREYYVRVLAR
jgi:hypothetical protein